MIIQLSIAGVSIALIFLIISLIRLLKKGMSTLGETNMTLVEVRNAVHGLTHEANQLIHTANQVTIDVKDRIQFVDPLLELAHDVGEVIHSMTNTVKQAAEVLGTGLQQNLNSSASSRPIRINVK